MIVLLRLADRARRIVWRIFGPRTIGVRGLVVDQQGRVLLVRHSYGPPAWHLPGGGVKRRESLVTALQRELAQECGITITGPLRLLGTYSNLRGGKSDHISVFLVEAWHQEEVDDAEIAGIGFFDPAGLPADASPGTRRRLEEWAAGEVSDFSW
ncbi:MAG: NUDIX domain-containing protein [Actinobacteria bacterium]|nr:NUDIX domain-containing protein [Actinomycetota bacterium]